jgi:hypothetical protein
MPFTDYKKEVRVKPFGMVDVNVAQGERKVATKLFCTPFFSSSPATLEKVCERAHKWADEIIAVCQRQEC